MTQAGGLLLPRACTESLCVSRSPLPLITLTACGETSDPAEGGFGDSASASADETGGTGQNPENPDVGPGLLDPGECLADPREGAWGYKYQCGGAFFAEVGATYDGEDYSVFVPSNYTTGFGENWEPYEHAKVIACCGEYDFDASLTDQPTVAENCLLDFRQQACLSIAVGLAKLIDDGTIPSFGGKAIDVQNWIAQNSTACIAGLVDTHPSPTRLEARWELPANGPWAPQLSDVYVEVFYAQLLETGIYAPEDGPAICTSLNDNNNVFFTDQTQPPLSAGFDVKLESGSGSLLGPVYLGGRVSGAGSFASLTTACTDPNCSYAQFSTDASGTWAIDRMQLFVDGRLIVSNGTDEETLDDVRIELYRQVLGTVQTTLLGTQYVIPARAAHFVVSGKSGDDIVTLAVPNATEITATMSAGEWTVDPFDLVYVDDASNTWTLTVGSSDWL